jgi:hypothetical protein
MVAGSDDTTPQQRDRLSHRNKTVVERWSRPKLAAAHERQTEMTSFPRGTACQRQGPVDEAMQAYVDWRMECIAVWETYGRWTAASAADAALAFGAYTAALEREERACEVYADLIRLPGDSAATDCRNVTDLAASRERHR